MACLILQTRKDARNEYICVRIYIGERMFNVLLSS